MLSLRYWKLGAGGDDVSLFCLKAEVGSHSRLRGLRRRYTGEEEDEGRPVVLKEEVSNLHEWNSES